MATTPNDVQAAITALRSALTRLHDLGLQRDSAVRKRTVIAADITAINEQIAAARVEVQAARAAAAAALADMNAEG